MDLRHLDVFPLRCLCALVSEQHVTRAADLMNISQPQMSSTLRRLRDTFADPILIRTEKGMVATPRAQEIADSVLGALDAIDRVLQNTVKFDPKTDQRLFHISASESVALAVMPEVAAALRRESSGIVIRVHSPNVASMRQELEDGKIDMAIGYFRNPPEGLRHVPLTTQKLTVIAAANHPTISDEISLAQYVAASHARYSLSSSGTSEIEDEIDHALGLIGVERKTGIQLPSAVAIPPVVAETDIIATIPVAVARLYARALPLKLLTPPFAASDVQIKMYWHERTHRQPAAQWLRSLIANVFSRE